MHASRWSRWFAAVLLALGASTTSPSAQEPTAALSLRVTDELAPPGAIVQMKIELTEPKPISTGGGHLSFAGFDAVDGVAVLSPQNDTVGVAVVEEGDIAMSFTSRSATFGTLNDYPLVTITGRVPANVPLGAVFPFTLNSLEFRNAKGKLHAAEVKDGSLTIASVLAIHDVQPGSATLQAGAVVKVLGSGFRPDTKIQFGEADIASTHFVSASRIDVVLGSRARMHGMRIRAENDDGPRIEYFSYQRAHRAGASVADPYRHVVPVFPNRSALKTVVDLSGHSAGIAVQNIKSADSTVTAELFAPDGTRLAKKMVTLPSHRFLVNEISEFFEVPYQSGHFVRVRATSPVQVMGVSVSESGAASPLLPR
jgi:hypothetical protein